MGLLNYLRSNMAAFRVLELQHKQHRRPRIYAQRLKLDDIPEHFLVSRYRLDREGIYSLCDAISDDLEMSSRGRSISPMTQLLVTLRYLAKGDFLSETADLHGISRSSASRIIDRVVQVINRHIDNIRFPSGHALLQVKRAFFTNCKIPNIVGAIDGTLVPIIAPKENGETFVCRKGYNALNVQAVVDASMLFLDVVARWPGSTHDASIFEYCGLKDHLEESGVGHLLGDSGYPLRKTVITPVMSPTCGSEQRYNDAHIKGRSVVERGIWYSEGQI